MVSKLKRPYIHVVTTENLPGYTIEEVKGLVWGTTVRSKFIGKEILALMKVMLGGEIKEYSSLINEGRRYVIERMVDNARALGANAIIGMRLGSATQPIAGSAEIVAYGTAVVVRPVKGGKR